MPEDTHGQHAGLFQPRRIGLDRQRACHKVDGVRTYKSWFIVIWWEFEGENVEHMMYDFLINHLPEKFLLGKSDQVPGVGLYWVSSEPC